jgi:chromosome segregation ATPase
MTSFYDGEELVEQLRATGDSELRELAAEFEYLTDEYRSISGRIEELEDEQLDLESEIDGRLQEMADALFEYMQDDEDDGVVRDSKDELQLGLLDA